MEEKRGKGQPRSFKDAKAFLDAFTDYLKYCDKEEKMANIAGFCWYTGITRETYYKQQEYYSDAFKNIEQALEDRAINHKAPAIAIFYLKNKFGYKDKQEVDQTNVNMNIETDMTPEEADQILKRFGVEIEIDNSNTKQK